MNKKLLIGAVVLAGLCFGVTGAYLMDHQGHNMMNHLESKDMNHDNHKKMDHSMHSSSKTVNKDMKQGMKQNMKQNMNMSSKSRAAFDQALTSYFQIQKALSKDDLSKAKHSTTVLLNLVTKTKTPMKPTAAEKIWVKESAVLITALKELKSAKKIADSRIAFEKISVIMERVLVHFGSPEGQTVYKYNCPMFQGKGADWLQDVKGTKNPYYGSQMLGCGSVVKKFQ